jgi:hypothetical protein
LTVQVHKRRCRSTEEELQEKRGRELELGVQMTRRELELGVQKSPQNGNTTPYNRTRAQSVEGSPVEC